MEDKLWLKRSPVKVLRLLLLRFYEMEELEKLAKQLQAAHSLNERKNNYSKGGSKAFGSYFTNF